MTLFNKLIGNNTLKSYVKFDFFLLLAGILLQQVHPMYTSWIFALIIIRDFQHRKMYAFCKFLYPDGNIDIYTIFLQWLY